MRAFSAVLSVILLSQATKATADIALDPSASGATITDAKGTDSLHLRLDQRCFIDSLSIFGRPLVTPQTGVCTAVKLASAWYTTRENIPRLRRRDADQRRVAAARLVH